MAIPWMLIAMGAGSALKLMGGYSTMKSAEAEARAMKEQGDLGLYESAYKARLIKEEAVNLQGEQTMKYIMSGVQIAGTPIAMLDDTINKAQRDIAITIQQGYNVKKLAYSKADNLKKAGRAAMLGEIADTAFSIAGVMQQGGIFNPTPKKPKTDKKKLVD